MAVLWFSLGTPVSSTIESGVKHHKPKPTPILLTNSFSAEAGIVDKSYDQLYRQPPY
jgi:hypothetical protein